MTAAPRQPAASPTPPANVQHAARARRVKVLTAAGITLVSCLAVAAMLNVLASRFHTRADMTATGEQQLAPRTRTLLETAKSDSGNDGYRVIVATDLRSTDARARTNLADVLDAMHAFRADFAGTLIDTGSPRGLEQFRALSRDLYDRNKAAIEGQLTTLRDAAAGTKSLEGDLTATLSPQLLRIRDAISASSPQGATLRTYYENAAAGARVRAGDLSRAIGDAQQLAPQTQESGEPVIPATDKAAAALRTPLEAAAKDIAALAKDIERFVQAGTAQGTTIEPAAVDAARIAAGQVSQSRDRISLILEKLKGIERLDATRVADVLRAGSAALVLAPEGKGVVAIDLPAILPSSAWLDAAQASNNDLRRRVEDVIATSIASLASPVRPILVLTHAEQRPMLLEQGWTDALRERLYLRGIDCVEWSINASPAPDTAGIADAAKRPKVYLILSTNDSAAAPSQGAPTGAQRAAKLAEEVTRLLGEGRPMIVSLAPSMLPGFGEQDPMSKALDAYGVHALTGTPLLTEVLTPRGRSAETDRIVQGDIDGPATHALAGAVRGLPMYLTWAVPLEKSGSGSAKVWPILTVPTSGSNPPTTWAEGEWQRFRSVRREDRALMPDQPSFSPARDKAAPQQPIDGSTGWTVIAAVESTAGATPTRLLVVGSNDWFIDQVTQQGTMVDGRAMFQNPGNLELLENGILWLTNQDQLIAQSATSRAVPIVRPIADGPLRTLRLAVVLGLPALVLVVGVLLRAMRR